MNSEASGTCDHGLF